MAKADQCRVERVDRRDAERLARIRAIYAEAFPESERKPAGFLAEALDRDDYELIGLSCAGRVEGFALLYLSPGGAFALLEYMAVAAGMRDRGLGAILFQDVMFRLSERTLLLEVETETGSGPESAASKRARFYRGLGCTPVRHVDYAMPRVGSAAPPPMTLLACGGPPSGPERAALRRWLEEIYDRVYDRRLSRAELERMLPSAAEE